MPFLRVEQGSCPGQILEVDGDRTVIGRHPSCQIVLDNAAVSRQHAQISEVRGTFYLEDLRSRNQTFLNGRLIEGSTKLTDGDAISVCDMAFRFFLDVPGGEPVPMLDHSGQRNPNHSRLSLTESKTTNDSSILGTVSVGEASNLLLGVKPEQKLRAVLDMGRSLGHALELREVLENTIEGLFQIFPQADHGFILFRSRDQLDVKAARSRFVADSTPKVSLSVVRRAIQEGEAILSADLGGDARFTDSESVAEILLRSVLCIPLYSEGSEPFGVVQLDSLSVDRTFSKDDLDLLASLAGQIGLAIENARLHSELITQRELQRELDFAMQVQLGFLPTEPPNLPQYEFFDYYEAAQRVGGDYFDYVELGDGRLAVTLGDVAGKGVAAALLMARLFASARYQLLSRPSAGEALTGLNAELARTGLGHRFVTCIFAIIDSCARTLEVANAGHMAPLIRNATGEVIAIGQRESGMPVGIAKDQDFENVTHHIAPGDTLVLYTDGVTEAMNGAGDLYGRQRLVNVLQKSPDPIQATIESIVSDVNAFVGDSPQRDDICLVGFRCVQ